MKCPYCGSRFAGERQYCPNCKQPISRARPQAEAPERPAVREDPRRRGLRRALIAVAVLVCAFLVCLGVYKLTFWIGSYRINRLYTRGEYTPTVNTVTMDDGRVGHTIVFYGSDGDQIFLPELQKSLSISGGVARVTIADSDWFSGDVTDVEAANVRLSPMLVDERGSRTQLPEIAFTVEVPDSPLTVLSPAEDGLNVVTARYPLDLQVVPGSTVIVNGEDVTDTVSRSGELDQTVNVYPIGDNTYTIIVRTPQHHETRREITIHREKYDIEFELNTSVATTSDSETMTVAGTIEPGASISVETDYIEESLLLDRETGEFSFIAKLDSFGDNLIRFRVQMDGRQDAVIRLNVQYRPTLAKYSQMAWAMDYDGLRRLYERWTGQVFKCVGPIVDTMVSDGKTYYIMDVGTDGEQQLIILENQTKITNPSYGTSYTAYAHVSGREMYNAQYYPMLTALYMDLTPANN